MKLTLQLQLVPTADQKATLLETMARFNAAATFAAKAGYEAKVYSQPSIHKLAYKAIRDRFGLSAQMAVRAIGKAVECFKRDRKKCPTFRDHGAVTYDERILSFKGVDRVSLWTLAGRQLIPLVYGSYQSERFDRIRGQVDLVYRKGRFYLYVAADFPEKPPVDVEDFVGVDLGIVNIATDSDGKVHSGDAVEKARRKHHNNRRRLQKKQTKGAKKRLKKLSGKEAAFRRHVNHCISKAIVRLAKDTGRGIALEDLRGIRKRTTVRRQDRARHSSWAFSQLRLFVEYKAKRDGVPLRLVDPRDTSRACAECGHVAKENRRSQADFECVACGHRDHADRNAARNIRARAECKAAPELGKLIA